MTEDEKQKLLSVTREMYGRIAYTHKVHEKQRAIISKSISKYKKWNILLQAITFLFALGSAVWLCPLLKFLTPITSAIALWLTLYNLSFSKEKQEALHRQTAKKFLYFRDKLTFLIARLMGEFESTDNLREQIEGICREVTITYEYAPDTDGQAYSEAQTALKEEEELTFSDEEIDKMLPSKLRIGNKE
ncbi:MAG: SLATT domain-containing protein [Candidatus Caenarcaniphilales bacterium]|nr:SLATT domain-containing protein [Candidatus Caenarcaniphilales bacterium]